MPTGDIDILLVEDNADDVALTLRALQTNTSGARVHVARDGEEALDFLFARGPYSDRSRQVLKLVLLDLKLPKVGGIEVLRAAKSDPRTKIIPIVVLSASAEQRDLRESYSLGANSYIQKPLNFDDFRAIVAELRVYWLKRNEPPPSVALDGQ